jgi:hypothetical protein
MISLKYNLLFFNADSSLQHIYDEIEIVIRREKRPTWSTVTRGSNRKGCGEGGRKKALEQIPS